MAGGLKASKGLGGELGGLGKESWHYGGKQRLHTPGRMEGREVSGRVRVSRQKGGVSRRPKNLRSVVATDRGSGRKKSRKPLQVRARIVQV